MTNVRRPIHLQLRPASLAPADTCSPPKALSPTGDSLPSQILPHLFVGNHEQTNRETLNRLNISYILSLGLLPLISSSASPTSPTTTTTTSGDALLLPTQNSSLDFKIRVISIQEMRDQNKNKPSPDTNENKAIKLVRSIHCKCINIADSSDQNLTKFFDEAHQFIDEARRKKCNILVHCLAGISRSPTIAIAYLMRVNSLPLQDAYNLVKQCRPQIDPNLSFMGQLMVYEKTLQPPRRSTGGRKRNVIEAQQRQKL